MAVNKEIMLKSLPLVESGLSIRLCSREDINRLSQWPEYHWPNNHFKFSFSGLTDTQRDSLFEQRQNDLNRITLVIDSDNQKCTGYLALLEIDWSQKVVNDMSLRIIPALCNKGIGTSILNIVSLWSFGHGIQALRLNVAAPNAAAVRCYTKAGFVKTKEFWQPDEKLANVSLDSPKYDFLLEHLRMNGKIPNIRFWQMELRKK